MRMYGQHTGLDTFNGYMDLLSIAAEFMAHILW